MSTALYVPTNLYGVDLNQISFELLILRTDAVCECTFNILSLAVIDWNAVIRTVLKRSISSITHRHRTNYRWRPSSMAESLSGGTWELHSAIYSCLRIYRENLIFLRSNKNKSLVLSQSIFFYQTLKNEINRFSPLK